MRQPSLPFPGRARRGRLLLREVPGSRRGHDRQRGALCALRAPPARIRGPRKGLRHGRSGHGGGRDDDRGLGGEEPTATPDKGFL